MSVSSPQNPSGRGPELPEPLPPGKVSRWWLVPMLAVLAGAVAAVEVAYGRYPIPPGVDPGDWIQRSYAWVGLPAVTPNAVGSPYLYPPLMFPIIGLLERLTGNPLTTGFVFGGLLLVLFGLTTIHLGRRFFTTGPGQLLFVGLSILCGTTLQMLFWGGYPNFLALVFVNEALVYLLLFVRTRSTWSGVAFWSLLSVVYLTHDLTFDLLAAALGLAFVLWWVRDHRFWRILVARGSLLGIPILVGTVALYNLALRLGHIQTPGYFGSNPTAYNLDNLGSLFRPLAQAPLLLPLGPVQVLASTWVEVLLLVAAAVVVAVLLLLDRGFGWWDDRWVIAASYGAMTLLLPVGGWLVHADTDYTRFAYFLPLPVILGLSLAVDPLLAALGCGPAPAVNAPGGTPASPSEPAPPGWLPRSGREGLGAVVVAVLLVAVFVGSSWPTITTGEQVNASQDHDTAVLEALHFLASDPTPGNVLTLQGNVRWVEAVSVRGAFDIGPTWLLFEPWQIVNAEETYWAFSERYALTNNLEALGFSGGYGGIDTSPVVSAPLYAAYIDGVAVPMVDLPTAGVQVNATANGTTALEAAGSWNPPVLTIGSGSPPVAYLNFTGPLYNVSESAEVAPARPAEVVFRVTPAPGVLVHDLVLNLAAPSSRDALLAAPASAGVTGSGATLTWSVSSLIGPNLAPTTERTTTSFAPAPVSWATSAPGASNAAAVTWSDPGGGAASYAVTFATAGAANPAIQLPPLLDTAAFLAEHDIRFLLLPTKGNLGFATSYYQALFGWHIVYSNPSWTVAEA